MVKYSGIFRRGLVGVKPPPPMTWPTNRRTLQKYHFACKRALDTLLWRSHLVLWYCDLLTSPTDRAAVVAHRLLFWHSHLVLWHCDLLTSPTDRAYLQWHLCQFLMYIVSLAMHSAAMIHKTVYRHSPTLTVTVVADRLVLWHHDLLRTLWHCDLPLTSLTDHAAAVVRDRLLLWHSDLPTIAHIFCQYLQHVQCVQRRVQHQHLCFTHVNVNKLH